MTFQLTPEFMDIFGFMAFAFITIFACYILKTNKTPRKWLTIILLVIGILGIIVDGTIVYINFLK